MTVIDEKRIRIAAELYEARDVMRRLLGSRYPTVVAKWCDVLKRIAEPGDNYLQAAMVAAELLQERHESASVPLVLAAAVELIEPSEELVHANPTP
jgi:hypothetical protein